MGIVEKKIMLLYFLRRLFFQILVKNVEFKLHESKKIEILPFEKIFPFGNKKKIRKIRLEIKLGVIQQQ